MVKFRWWILATSIFWFSSAMVIWIVEPELLSCGSSHFSAASEHGSSPTQKQPVHIQLGRAPLCTYYLIYFTPSFLLQSSFIKELVSCELAKNTAGWKCGIFRIYLMNQAIDLGLGGMSNCQSCVDLEPSEVTLFGLDLYWADLFFHLARRLCSCKWDPRSYGCAFDSAPSPSPRTAFTFGFLATNFKRSIRRTFIYSSPSRIEFDLKKVWFIISRVSERIAAYAETTSESTRTRRGGLDGWYVKMRKPEAQNEAPLMSLWVCYIPVQTQP